MGNPRRDVRRPTLGPVIMRSLLRLREVGVRHVAQGVTPRQRRELMRALEYIEQLEEWMASPRDRRLRRKIRRQLRGKS